MFNLKYGFQMTFMATGNPSDIPQSLYVTSAPKSLPGGLLTTDHQLGNLMAKRLTFLRSLLNSGEKQHESSSSKDLKR